MRIVTMRMPTFSVRAALPAAVVLVILVLVQTTTTAVAQVGAKEGHGQERGLAAAGRRMLLGRSDAGVKQGLVVENENEDEDDRPAGPGDNAVTVRGPNAHKFQPASDRASRIPGKFIVQVSDEGDLNELIDRAVRPRGGKVGYKQYNTGMRWFSVKVPTGPAGDNILESLLNEPAVRLVQEDALVYASQTLTTQTQATWGLDRINQESLPLDSSYSYTSNGAGVYAYVLDTGIAPHTEFGSSRLLPGRSFISNEGTIDFNGHGTHVAGTIGGTTFGVAKGVSLVPVKVLSRRGSGALSGIVAGIDWVILDTRPGKAARKVINMSLGSPGIDPTFNAAVERAVVAGVVVVVAAGNEGTNACKVSPASATNALTIGATDSNDARTSWSNFGACVDLFAPGESITSTWIGSSPKAVSTATNTISGTSMAAPHVAGAVARILSTAACDGATGSGVAGCVSQALIGAVTSGKVTNLPLDTTTTDKLLYMVGTSR